MATNGAVARFDEGQLIGRGISFPFRLGPNGQLAWSSGAENVRETIRTILLTEIGERIMLPEFGARLQSALFEPNTPATRRLIQKEIEEGLERWEPRVEVQSVAVEADPADDRAAIATITYRLRATQASEQTALRVSLGG